MYKRKRAQTLHERKRCGAVAPMVASRLPSLRTRQEQRREVKKQKDI